VAGLDPPTLLLDGEIAVFDRHLVSHFEWLRGRPKDDTATPPLLMAFDCLYARGKDLRKRALGVRRNVLEELVAGQHLVLPVRRLAENGLEAGPRCWSAATRGWSGRTRPQPTWRGGRSPGARSRSRTTGEGERGWEPKNS
jgi:ATP-dependent DNA ligase